MFKRILIVIVVIFLVFLGIEQKKEQKHAISVFGSSLTSPVSKRISEIYKKDHKQLLVLKTDEDKKIMEQIETGDVDVGVVSILSGRDEKSPKLNYLNLGFDAMVFIVNAENPIEKIDGSMILDIYTKKIKNWKDVSDWDKRIFICSEKSGNSLSSLFEQYFGLKNPGQPKNKPGEYISQDTHITGSPLETVSFVADMPGAIGFTSLSTVVYLKQQGVRVKILPFDGVKPTQENILSNKYPATIELDVVYKKEQQNIQDFLKVCTYPEVRNILKELNFVTAK